ncbi:extracellular matrix/biofilm biosynthesis regulator RemA family protein [Clostridium sp. WILCCON 0269]|uniref:Extracellular matrix/biofilm biosynthesis regulator RemA family protein n=1 Tax=Candidatus Clostridium eludens TaxID=3381663 RepID=A0ABW8SEY2_9CLOT
MKIIDIGFNNLVVAEEIQLILSVDGVSIKRRIAEAKKREMLVDITKGRNRRSVILLKSGIIVLSSVNTKTLVRRILKEANEVGA